MRHRRLVISVRLPSKVRALSSPPGLDTAAPTGRLGSLTEITAAPCLGPKKTGVAPKARPSGGYFVVGSEQETVNTPTSNIGAAIDQEPSSAQAAALSPDATNTVDRPHAHAVSADENEDMQDPPSNGKSSDETRDFTQRVGGKAPPTSANGKEAARTRKPKKRIAARGKSSKLTKQQLFDSLSEETKQLFILDGLSRGDIKSRLQAQHKNVGEETINKVIQHTFDDLVKEGLADGNGNRYFINDGKLFLAKGYGDESRLKKLTNFYLTSIGKIVQDDGVEEHHSFEIEAKLDGHTAHHDLSAEDFNQMRWPMKVLGPHALVTPRIQPEAEYGLRVTARQQPERLIFTHTGWRIIDRGPYYLHADGAIGVNGNRRDVRATLPEKLRNFSLPDPPTGEELIVAIRASMGLLGAVNDLISIPLFSAIYRAPLGDAAMTAHSSGTTGLRKTAVKLVAQKHYGKNFDESSVPHWDSTSGFLKESLFIAKDAVLLVDDFVPTGGGRDIRNAHKGADDVIRSVGNRSGRGRLGKDGKPQIPHEPRCLMLSTGETRPTGHSLRARTVHLSFNEASVNNERLAKCQADAKEGLCAQAMAAYLQDVAQRYDFIREHLKTRTDELRDLLATEGRLLRSANNLASLAVGLEVFLSFAIDAGAITAAEADELWERSWHTFRKLAVDQDDLQQTEDPAREVLLGLNSASLNGRIYLKDLDPGEETAHPTSAIRVGWKETTDDGTGEDWYCEPDALYTAIVQHYRDQDLTLPWRKDVLWQRLAEQGYTRESGDRKFYFRKSIDGKQQRLICIPAETFRKIDAETDPEKENDADLNVPARWSWEPESSTVARDMG